MSCIFRLGLGLGTVGAIAFSHSIAPAIAVRFADGTVQFAGVPSLGKVSTTDNQASAWSATYFFTLQVPPDASEPLARMVLRQTEGLDPINFNLRRTYAYLNGDRRQTTPLTATWIEKDALELRFEPPIAPGITITLGLRPYNNPRSSGVYLFGVTVFPAGEKVRSQFIGTGRLQFYDRNFWHDHWWR